MRSLIDFVRCCGLLARHVLRVRCSAEHAIAPYLWHDIRGLVVDDLAGLVHPVSFIGSTKAGERRFSFFVNRELTSVLAPGVFVVTELTYLTLRLRSASSAAGVLDHFKNISGTVGLLLLLIYAATGFVVGYVLRELAFRLLGVLEKLPRVRRGLAPDTAGRLADYFDAGLLQECLKAHPYLQGKFQVTDRTERPAGYRKEGGANVETRDYESFVYAKLWIRNFSAGLSIDSVELEINMLTASLAPSALLAVDILVSVHLSWFAILLTVIALALVWWVLLDSLFRLRRTERWEAVRNLVMDYAMRSAAAGYPAVAEAEEAPE